MTQPSNHAWKLESVRPVTNENLRPDTRTPTGPSRIPDAVAAASYGTRSFSQLGGGPRIC
jgi:hypothetical protein